MAEKRGNETEPERPQPSARSKAGILLTFALLLALLGLLAWGLVRVQAGPRDQGSAPDFTLTGFDGRTAT
jgi:flagellar biogenesis protein FliO